ncbi:MAG: hypothetical protein LBV06_07180 [Propionibacteriaceae bacterium]|nr:hypothetical protein [Propionibacteriaceae bacterium]
MMSVQPPTEHDLWYDYRFGGGPLVALAASQVDALIGANWQRAGRKTGKPKPIKRPQLPHTHTGTAGRDIDDFRSWYADQPGGRPLT